MVLFNGRWECRLPQEGGILWDIFWHAFPRKEATGMLTRPAVSINLAVIEHKSSIVMCCQTWFYVDPADSEWLLCGHVLPLL